VVASRTNTTPSPAACAGPPADVLGLIAEAASNVADYQGLPAAGKLGEAGQKLQ
jgi:hypothetical protein